VSNPDMVRFMADHLKAVLYAWDYNGGGDAWCREVYGDDILAAREALEAYEKQHGKITTAPA